MTLPVDGVVCQLILYNFIQLILLIIHWKVPFPGHDLSVVERTQKYQYIYDNQRPIQIQRYFSQLFRRSKAKSFLE